MRIQRRETYWLGENSARQVGRHKIFGKLEREGRVKVEAGFAPLAIWLRPHVNALGPPIPQIYEPVPHQLPVIEPYERTFHIRLAEAAGRDRPLDFPPDEPC